jgi:hypothetical protein
MKAVSRYGLLLAAALTAIAAMAASAQADHGAVGITPDNTTITGTATNPTLEFEGTIIQCDMGTATGSTGTDSDIVNFALAFSGNCNVNGLGTTVTCSTASGANDEEGTARWHVLTTNTGEIDRLNEGFSCDVVVLGVCTVSVDAQELPIPGGVNRADPVDGGIDVEVDVIATNDNSLCGPTPEGVGRFTAFYDLNPTITID